MKERIIVTGASGFVGAHIACGLAAVGMEVLAVGGRKPIPAPVLQAASGSASSELSDEEQCRLILDSWTPDVIVHAAALADAARCQQNPELARQANPGTAAALIAACRQRQSAPFIIYISTDLVFDGAVTPARGFTEDDEALPLSVYAKTKREAENIVLTSELPAAVLRISLAYGEKIERLEGFMGWIRTALEAQEHCSGYTDEFRTPVFTADIVRTLEALVRRSPLERRRALAGPRGPLLHLGGSERMSRYEFARLAARTFGYPEHLILPHSRLDSPSLVARPADVSLCTAKLQRALGFVPMNPQRGLEVLRKHPNVDSAE
jgi:dTDP-4-dehydrorhamnose reductase